MVQQIPLDITSRVDETQDQQGTRQVAPDLAYLRLAFVNVVFHGLPGAGDRGWVLIDTGVTGMAEKIVAAAGARFGEGARPAAIIQTHGHFDHVGALVDLAERWDVPVYAHRLEHPYLNGTASYPPADPSVGGGLMALLSPLYPRKPVDVGGRLLALPEDGTVPAMPGWRWLHTPGHAPGHVSLWHAGSATLVAGDAIVTTGQESAYEAAVQEPEMHGPPQYFTPDWQSAGASVRLLAGLDPGLVITGHGRALGGAKMREALHRLADNFTEIAVPEGGRYVADPARPEDGSVYR